jgi:transposase
MLYLCDTEGMDNGKLKYDTDLTDEQWAVLAPLVPVEGKGGRPLTYHKRAIVEAILYIAKTGCQRLMPPNSYPSEAIVRTYFRRWSEDGTWEKPHDALQAEVRRNIGKEESPSVGIVDSQIVKGSQKGGPRISF